MVRRPFAQLDVFGAEPLYGNPLAVVYEATDLDTSQMEAFTRWTNLSECTFLLPPASPEADYAVRIFTGRGELPFAGHPTLGTARAWLAAGNTPKSQGVVIQECGAGLIPVRISENVLAFAAPSLIRSGEVDAEYRAQVLAILGIGEEEVLAMAWIDNGPGWVGVLLRNSSAVLALQPDVSRYTGTGSVDIGVVGETPDGDDADFEIRAFYTGAHGDLREDPVTGSLNASVAQWLQATGVAPARYTARQGTALGVRGRISIDADNEGAVWVGGTARVIVQGWIEI